MKQFVEIILYISGTGSCWPNHWPVVGKVFDKLAPNFFSLFPESAIEGHLPTTGLVGIVMYLMTQLFKDPDHIKARLRKKLIDEAWNEDVDGHGR